MEFSAGQIAAMIKGTVQGNANVQVKGFGKIETAMPGQLSFLANSKYEDYLYSTEASLVIINESLVLKAPVNTTLIRVPDAYSAFAILLNHYQSMQINHLSGVDSNSMIDPTATLGENVYVGTFTFIGAQAKVGNNTKIFPQVYIGNNVQIGDNCVLYPGVKIYNDCTLGNHVVIHAGSVIGADGFGFAPQPDGSYQKVPQIGNVIIEDLVEIGANTTIDRATIGSTIIHSGAKLDNLVQIAHNVQIGNHTVIAAQAGISGSTKIGNYVMIGGQTGMAGHIQVADRVKINGQSGITKSIKQNDISVTGTPAFEFTAAMRSQAVLRRLPELEKRIIELENQLRNLSEGK